MSDDFHATIGALWASLGLAAPPRGPEPKAALTIDGFRVTFEEAADGRRLLVAGTAGRLSDDPRQRAEQVRRILRANPAFALRNRAGVALEPAPGPAAPVRVLGIYPYGRGQVTSLADLVQDVLELLEIHARDLRGGARQPGDRLREPAFAPTDSLIFRP